MVECSGTCSADAGILAGMRKVAAREKMMIGIAAPLTTTPENGPDIGPVNRTMRPSSLCIAGSLLGAKIKSPVDPVGISQSGCHTA